jgi:flagellar biosynthesis component FlhA
VSELPPPAPLLKLSLELPSSVLGTERELPLQMCESAIRSRVNALMETLGIPGSAAVSITVDTATPAADRALRLSVNGEPCRYSDELLHWTASYVLGAPAVAGASVASVWRWIAAAARARADRSGRPVIDFVTETSVEILKCNRRLLLGDDQVEAYAAGLEPPLRLAAARDVWPPSPSWLGPVLRDVLELRAGIGDRRAVATVLADAENISHPRAVVEELVAAIGPSAFEIQLAADVADRLTAGETASVRETFAFIRDGMFVETGMSYPEFHLVIADDLKPGTFAFAIGPIRTPPLRALGPDEHLVNDTRNRLKKDKIKSRRASNPATAQPAAIVSTSQRDVMGKGLDGRTTWDFRGHLILSMAAVLRQQGYCFVNRNFTRDRLDLIGRVFPAIGTHLAAKGYTDVHVTGVFRALVAEEISIRNTRRILDLLIQCPFSQSDDRLLLEWVRKGMSRALREKYARGTDVLVVYLLEPRIEAMISRPKRQPTEAEWDAILSAVRTETAFLPLTAQRPAVLTTALARPALRKALESEFPRIPVICFEELPPSTTVQPVARIALAAAATGAG